MASSTALRDTATRPESVAAASRAAAGTTAGADAHGSRQAQTEDRHTWKPLRLFSLYRIVLALLLLASRGAGPLPQLLGQTRPGLYTAVALAYLGFALAGLWSIQRRRPDFSVQANTQAVVDIFAITLLMHASGGPSSGLGILIVVAIAGASIVLEGRQAFLHAAIATLAVLGDQAVSQLYGLSQGHSYTHAGLLGISFFASAYAAHSLAARLRESEALARRRGVDVANLEALNEHIVHQMQAGIVVVDGRGRVRLLNQAARRLLGAEGLARHGPLRQLRPALAEAAEAWRARGGAAVQRAPVAIAPDDRGTTLHARFTPLGPDPDGGYLILLEDAAEVTAQLQQLKLASLGRLTASIAHEIRNPLGAISHASQLLAEGEGLSAADRRLAQIIEDHSRRLNRMVENVLQLSRPGASQPQALALAPWLEHFADEFAGARQLPRGQIAVAVEPESLAVCMDPVHLYQIVWNLAQNALDHAAGGDPARLRLVLRARGDGSGGASLEVADNGPGIGARQAAALFEPFHTTAAGGTGLGLYLARELAERNGATLELRPGADTGACFRLSFPPPDCSGDRAGP